MIRPGIKSSLQVILPWLLLFVVDLVKKPQSITDVVFLWYYLPGYLIWMVITLPTYKVFSWSTKLKLPTRVAFLIVLGMLVGLGKVIVNRVVFLGSGILFEKIPASITLTQLVGDPFFLAEASIISWVMIIIFYVIEITKKYQDKSLETSRLEAALTQANLQTLKMQIRPHFLFNAHNAIATLMRSEKNEEALEMLLKLSALLRTSLNNFENQLVTLEEEIDFARKYLEIEKIRFEDRLEVEVVLKDELKGLKVPVFILQPLVENGVVHGVNKSLGQSTIRISAQKKDENLEVKVFNSGVLNVNGEAAGIGLSNVENRLDTLWKGKATVNLKQVGSGVEATLTLPCLAEKKKIGNENSDH